jgi:hypothetical protein
MKKLLFFLALIFIFTVSLSLAAPIGKITQVQGRVDVLKTGKNMAAPVSLGAPVDIGDIYRAKTNSKAEITFINNNILRIAPATKVEIKEYMAEGNRSSAVMRLHRGRVQAISGEEFIKRVAAFAEGNKFEVHTPNAVAGIRGSDMLVGFNQGTTLVIFIAGHGYLYNPESPQVFTPIVAGQMSFVTGEGTPSAPVKASEALISGGGEGFIQIIETKGPVPGEAPPPAPPPVYVPPSTGGPGWTNFTGEIYGNMFDDTGESFIGGLVEPSTFTGNIPNTGVGTLSASAGVSLSGEATQFQGFIEGTSDKGGVFYGPLAGVQGSWLNRTSALYVEGGKLYFLTGDAPGNLTESAFSMSGTFGKSSSLGTITLTPGEGETLLDALKCASLEAETSTPQFFPSYTPFIISNSGIDISPNYFMEVGPTLITNQGKKVVAIGNIYTGSYSPAEGASSLPYLGYKVEGEGVVEYGLGPLFYSHDTANKKFTVDTLLQSIGNDPDTGVWYLGVYSMRYLGMYDGSIFRMAGAGTYEGTPMSFYGYWGSLSMYNFYYNNSGVMAPAGYDIGYFGGTSAPWTSPASFTAIGEYGLDPSDKPHYLMNTYIMSYMAPDGSYPAGNIQGFAGAIWKDGNPDDPGTTVGSIDGAIRALYISTPAGGKVTAGIMKSNNFSGSYYPFATDSGMWGISGTLTPTPLATGLDPEDLDMDDGSMLGKLSGAFGGTGSIYGDASGNSWFLYTSTQSLPFGIFNIKFSGISNTYSNPSDKTVWSATLGGDGTFDSSESGYGYWLASVVSGTWTDTGEVRGNVTGKALTPYTYYDVEGKFYGVNNGTTWIGQAIGSYTGTDLKFVSEVNAGLFHYPSAWSASSGYLNPGLMGGTGTLWTGSPVPTTMISEYNPGDGTPRIWNTNIYSYNYNNETYTTYDGGAYNGFFGGRIAGDNLYGRVVTIYISPASGGKYTAGYLMGNFSGTAYPDITMAMMTGDLTTTPKNADIGITPTSLTLSPWVFPPVTSTPPLWIANNKDYQKAFWGKYSGGEITNPVTGSWSYTAALYNSSTYTAYPWGIYSMSHGGSYTGTPPAGWSAKIGGEGVFGAYYNDGFTNDMAYYLLSVSNGTWGDNKLTADVTGRYISFARMGTITGNLIGSYGAETGYWQAANVGVWEGNPLSFRSSVSTTYTQYYDGEEMKLVDDVLITGALGGTGSLFSGGSPSFTSIGLMYPGSSGLIWGTPVFSYSFVNSTNTTLDGGAYKGYLGGIIYPDSGSRLRTMLGKFYGLYIAPSSTTTYAAGYFTGGWTGTEYSSIGAYELDGTVTLTQKTADVGSIPIVGAITPDSFYNIVSRRYYAPDVHNLFVSGHFASTEGYLSGATDLDIMNIPGQNWGIYMAKSGGYFYNPNSRTTWNTVTGGKAVFGTCNLGTMTGGRYVYTDNGYYGYSYYNDQTGRSYGGVASYQDPTRVTGYERIYLFGAGSNNIMQSNFAYGDPYGRGRSYWYYTGTSYGTWSGTPADLPTVIAADAPSGGTLFTGPGAWMQSFFITKTEGSVEGGVKLTGTDSGRYIGNTTMGTFSGSLLGTADSETYQAISFGTWSSDYALKFQSRFLGYMYYGSDGVFDMSDGYTWFNMGGKDSLFGASTSINASAIGEYVPGDPTLNHIWYGSFGAINHIDGTYTTYDGGTYRGYFGAVSIPGATTDALDIRSYTVYVDASGKTGVLYGNMPGTGYPESMVFEADGTITRTQLGTDMPFAPKDIYTNTQTALGPVTTDYVIIPSYGHTRSEGGFLDANFTQLGDMTDRWDQTEILAFIEPYNTTYGFGVWKMNSLGAYDASISPTYYHLESKQIWMDGSDATRFLKIDGYGTWSGGKLTSMETSGYWGNWSTGRTALMAGQTMGAYNDSEEVFSAYSMGTWFGTPIYMQLASDAAGRQKLAALGFPSEPTTTVTFSGSQPSLSGTDVTLPISLYSFVTPPSEFARKVAASNTVSGNYSEILPYVGNIVVTNPGETFFGSFYVARADHSSYSDSDNWIGNFWGMGAIAVGSSYIQGDIDGYGAGTYTGTPSGSFSGSLAGQFFPVSNMSWITPDLDNRTKLQYYNGTTLLEDGYFKGVLDGNGPPDIWHSSESQSLDISMLGIYKDNEGARTSPTYASHIFSGEIYSYNYTNNKNTTTDGGAYWGILVGIQRDYFAIDGGGKSIGGFVGGLYISPTGKTGALLGYFGEVGDDYDNGWFDPNNAQWQADGKWYAVELGTSAILPSELTSYIDSHTFYCDTATSGGYFDGSGNITIASEPKWAEIFWIRDAPYAGLWATKFYGSYYDPSGGTYDWQFEVKGAASTTSDMGVLISGGPWQNKKFEGNAVGYWASIEDITGTGVLAGRVLGTFDASTYMAVAMGSWVETSKFLTLAATDPGKAKLQQLGIPAVQVGMDTLTGSGNGFDTLSMTNVRFFATSTTGKPTIWATGSTVANPTDGVTGTYTSQPNTSNLIHLMGSTLSADFQFKNWNTSNGRWLATVNGTGGYNTSTIFKGAAAGTGASATASPANPKSITGTAAGHAR